MSKAAGDISAEGDLQSSLKQLLDRADARPDSEVGAVFSVASAYRLQNVEVDKAYVGQWETPHCLRLMSAISLSSKWMQCAKTVLCRSCRRGVARKFVIPPAT